MEYKKLELYLSQPRLNRFLVAAGHSSSRVQDLYKANVEISQSFYPILNLFEIFLRNICNAKIAAHFNNSNWIIEEKETFMSHPSLSASNFYLKNAVSSAEKSLMRKSRLVTADNVVAEQSFGFWTSLFERHHYALIGGIVIHSFRNKPSAINRSTICQKLIEIRKFRNRVYHNEPICFNGNVIDFMYAEKIRVDIYEMLNWMDPDLKKYVEYFDEIDTKITAAKRI